MEPAARGHDRLPWLFPEYCGFQDAAFSGLKKPPHGFPQGGECREALKIGVPDTWRKPVTGLFNLFISGDIVCLSL